MAFVGWGVGALVKVAKKNSREQKGSKVDKEGDDDWCHGVCRDQVGDWSGHRHTQGGTHRETPRSVVLGEQGKW